MTDSGCYRYVGTDLVIVCYSVTDPHFPAGRQRKMDSRNPAVLHHAALHPDWAKGGREKRPAEGVHRQHNQYRK